MIKTVWLDNPPVNAISPGLIAHVYDELADLGDARVVVLRGRGERAFSAGADISGFQSDREESEDPAGIRSPDMISHAARPAPISRGARCVPPPPGSRPSFTSGKPNCASGVAIRRSQPSATSRPPPRQ